MSINNISVQKKTYLKISQSIISQVIYYHQHVLNTKVEAVNVRCRILIITYYSIVGLLINDIVGTDIVLHQRLYFNQNTCYIRG